MKKLLVLMLVLGIASMATAGLTFGTAPAVMNVGDPVSVSLEADAGTAGASSDVSFVGASGIVGLGVAGGAETTPGSDTVNPQGGAYVGYYQTIMGTTTPGGYTLGGEVVELDLSGLAVGTYTLYSYTAAGWNTNYTTNDSMSIQVLVPEPMTIGLLGLGGLFLRRRK